jgi:excisionase family DNA binding protein
LNKVSQCEQLLASLPPQQLISSKDKDYLLSLGKQVEKIWYSEDNTITFKKRIARTLLEEIIADVQDDQVKLIVHWQGGTHTTLDVKKNKTGYHRYVTSAEDKQLIEQLARYLSDADLAGLLTRLGKKTGHGLSWTVSRVCAFRSTHEIPAYKKNEHHQRGELLTMEVCEKLKLPSHTVIRLIKRNLLPATQVCKGAPWVIKEELLEKLIKQHGSVEKIRPLTESSRQKTLDFSTT